MEAIPSSPPARRANDTRDWRWTTPAGRWSCGGRAPAAAPTCMADGWGAMAGRRASALCCWKLTEPGPAGRGGDELVAISSLAGRPEWNWDIYGSLFEPLRAGFDATPTVGIAPLEVEFTDESTPAGAADEWRWALGDGKRARLSTRVYLHPGGVYTVTQWVTDTTTGETDVLTRTRTSPSPGGDDRIAFGYDRCTGSSRPPTPPAKCTPTPTIRSAIGWRWASMAR